MGRSIPSEGTFARRVDPCVVAAEPGVRNDNLSRFPHVEGDGRRNRPRAIVAALGGRRDHPLLGGSSHVIGQPS